MYFRFFAWICLGLLWGVLIVDQNAFAQLSPGELARPHAALEGLSNCTQCHAVGERVPDKKCLDCHGEIQQRRVQKRGYHAAVRDKVCVSCHSDHNGRDYEMIRWPVDSRDAFDHQLTGYVLEGRHAKATCRDCHRADRVRDSDIRKARANSLDHTFLGLRTGCAGCHTDAHRGQLGTDCAACHGSAGWKPATGFQHDRARFTLRGKHLELPCERCHPDEPAEDAGGLTRFRPLAFDGCAPCHTDPHKGRFAKTCDACHTTTGWHARKRDRFDHNLTRFSLVGKHRRVACQKCHGPDDAWGVSLFDRCAVCHADVHKGQFGRTEGKGACERCHDEGGFAPSVFDLEAHRETRFKLEGAHAAVPCMLCHRRDRDDDAIRFSWGEKALRCTTCHLSPHRGQFVGRIEKSGCEGCHDVASWYDVQFDHDRTAFPLEGKHREVGCDKCHPVVSDAQGRYRQFVREKKTCETCHRDVHGGQFQEKRQADCASCHTSRAWRADLFQHNRDAQFKLDGAHRDVGCDKCHPRVVLKSGVQQVRYRPLDTACAACHAGM